MVYDLIIIGSGPAGLAAAIYAARARLSFLVLEKMPLSGGQILNTYEVENYPGIPTIGGFELGMKLREHAEHQGTEMIHIEVRHISLEEQGRIKVLYTDGKEYRARTVILAMGAKYRTLGIPGEKELTGMGVSYCATCDGAFFRGRKVAVAGGGDVAAEDALFLARGCEKVYLIHRRDQLHAHSARWPHTAKIRTAFFDEALSHSCSAFSAVWPAAQPESYTHPGVSHGQSPAFDAVAPIHLSFSPYWNEAPGRRAPVQWPPIASVPRTAPPSSPR